MKFKAAITDGVPEAVFSAFGSEEFGRRFLNEVVGGIFGVENPTERPAEFYLQEPDQTINVGHLGIEVRITGVSRGGRAAKVFHQALAATTALCKETISTQLTTFGSGFTGRIQLFVVMMLDGEVETTPGSGGYSSVLETPPEWIEIAEA